MADKLITLGKKNSEASRRRALEIFYVRDYTGGSSPFLTASRASNRLCGANWTSDGYSNLNTGQVLTISD